MRHFVITALVVSSALFAGNAHAQFTEMVFEGMVGIGTAKGYGSVDKFGSNDTVGTSFEPITDISAAYTYSATAVTWTVTSTTAADVNYIMVYGLGSDYVEKSVQVQLTGQKRVQLPGTWLRVSRMYNNTTGEDATAGTVYLFEGDDTTTGGVPQTASKIRAKFLTAYQQTRMLLYTIPAGFYGQLKAISLECAKGDDADIIMMVRKFNKTFRSAGEFHCYQNDVEEAFHLGTAWPSRTDIEFRAKSAAGTSEVSGRFEILLIADGSQ